MPKSSKDWCARFIEDIAWRSKARRIRPDLPTEGWPVLYGDNDGEIHRDQEAQGDQEEQEEQEKGKEGITEKRLKTEKIENQRKGEKKIRK